MEDLKPVTRSIHANGWVDFVIVDEGLITVGEDEDVIILKDFYEGEPEVHTLNYKIKAASQYSNKLYLAGENNCINSYEIPSITDSCVISRFSTAPTCMDFSPDGSFLAIGAADFTVKVVNLDTLSHKVFLGHTAPILSIAYDVLEDYLATSSCDGTFRVWNISDKACLQKWVKHESCNDFDMSPVLAKMAWKPKSGEYLAIPVNRTIELFVRGNFEIYDTLEHDLIEQNLSIVLWSSCGKYIASCDTSTNIFIFSFPDTSLFKAISMSKQKICKMLFNQSDLFLSDTSGSLSLFQNILSISDQVDGEMFSESKLNESFELSDDNEDDNAAISLEKIKSKYTINEDFDENSVGLETVQEPKVIYKEELTPQQAFQPCSTPVSLRNRYLRYNLFGIVKCVSSNDGDTDSLHIELHDSTRHHPLYITNDQSFVLADVSDDFVAVASFGNEKTRSVIYCQHFGSIQLSNKNWSFTLPSNERALTLCIGGNWIAVGTSLNRLRIFSIFGLQLAMFNVPDNVVCTAAWKNMLYLCFTTTTYTSRTYKYQIYNIQNDVCIVSQGDVPLSDKLATISWAGFSNEGRIFIVDSNNNVLYLHRQIYHSVLDLSRHLTRSTDNHWVIGFTNTSIRTIMCRNSKYPTFLPVPIVSSYDLHVPLTDEKSEKYALEEEFVRHRLLSGSTSEMSSVLIKLFALACRSDQDDRAFEVCSFMPNIETLNLALKYSVKLKKQALSQRISNSIESKENVLEAQSVSNSPSLFSQSQSQTDEATKPELSSENFETSSTLCLDTPLASESFSLPSSAINPFRVVHTQTQNSVGSAIFDDLSLDTPKFKVKKKLSLNNDKPKPSKPVSFQTWFSENKSSLQEENPEMDNADLISVGMAKYKAIQQDSKNLKRNHEDSSSSNQKRSKLDISTQMKLSKFTRT